MCYRICGFLNAWGDTFFWESDVQANHVKFKPYAAIEHFSLIGNIFSRRI